MQIRSLFLLCMSAVAASATCLGGWMLLQMSMEYQLAGRVQRAVDIDALLFVAADEIGIERPIVGGALLANAPVGGTVSARLAAVRHEADLSLIQIEGRIAAVSYPGAAAQLAVVQKTQSDLTDWRVHVDATLSHPKSERDPDVVARYVASLNAVLEATSVALDIGDLAASQHDGTSMDLIALASHAWAVRVSKGNRTVPLIAAIDRGATLDLGQLRAQARFDGLISANWSPIAALGRRLAAVPGLAATIAAGRAAFDDYDRLCQDVISANVGGRPAPVSALDLGADAVRSTTVLMRIRDVALAAARTRVAESRAAALDHVVIAAIVLTLTVIVMIGVLMLLQRRIVWPVLILTEAIGRIARLELDIAIPAGKRRDEIGRMAIALDALRSGAIAGEQNKARISHLARHDALTGLPNRLAFQDSLQQAVTMAGRGQISAALCLDLDRFKAVNDTFGHPTGDLLLRGVADRLMACVRDVDVVCRIGGDEFVVLLVGVDGGEHAAVVAQRIVHALGEPFNLEGQSVSIGSSIGIAIMPQDTTSGVVLLKHADTALYRAKSEEKGSWRFFKPEMDVQLQERQALEHDLREAVRDEAFEVAYQPQYTIATGRLCGFEALLRWRHPVRGAIGPVLFIPVAEETGLIVPLGAWMLRHACAEAMHWPDHVKLAVNLSGVQFSDASLVRTVQRTLEETGFPARRLELEITETMLLKNSESNLAILRELHGLGIRIAMDDFGTGYSSLNYLRSFPFDKIKIDQSFVRDLPEQAESRAIIRAVVALGNSLGMTTTAEGVETAEQLMFLRTEGCDDAQGYLFSKPIWAAQARLLADGRASAAVAAA
jgi:diguanylate cyclase (GGDEF)-like protein